MAAHTNPAPMFHRACCIIIVMVYTSAQATERRVRTLLLCIVMGNPDAIIMLLGIICLHVCSAALAAVSSV